MLWKAHRYWRYKAWHLCLKLKMQFWLIIRTITRKDIEYEQNTQPATPRRNLARWRVACARLKRYRCSRVAWRGAPVAVARVKWVRRNFARDGLAHRKVAGHSQWRAGRFVVSRASRLWLVARAAKFYCKGKTSRIACHASVNCSTSTFDLAFWGKSRQMRSKYNRKCQQLKYKWVYSCVINK